MVGVEILCLTPVRLRRSGGRPDRVQPLGGPAWKFFFLHAGGWCWFAIMRPFKRELGLRCRSGVWIGCAWYEGSGDDAGWVDDDRGDDDEISEMVVVMWLRAASPARGRSRPQA